MPLFKQFRVFVLVLILLGVSVEALLTRNHLQDWSSTLNVAIFPINGDGSAESRSFINSLKEADFAPIEQYFGEQAAQYGLAQTRPIRIYLGSEIQKHPPEKPAKAGFFSSIYWSLAMRYWVRRNTPSIHVRPDIRIFALYFDPAKYKRLPDSTGLAKGQIGMAYLFADRGLNGSNLLVTTHEMLHTLGATDKYGLQTNQPIFPVGYAEPYKSPRYPQEFAEIMAGRVPMSETEANIPESVQKTMIGFVTAREIRWIK
ncbi:MAG: hypothetical protein H6R18_145 [Proteobacteria bacterium]|nr:hypothetical protein [Pseudomonadota bacterium]